MSDKRAMNNQAPVVTAEQLDELEPLYPGGILRGYLDGVSGAPWPEGDLSPAYEHGRRIGINDRAGVVDHEQRSLAPDLRWRGGGL